MARKRVTEGDELNAYGQTGEEGGVGTLIQPEADREIDVADLQREFRVYPSVLFAHNEAKAEAEKTFDLLKLRCEEAEAAAYIKIKSGPEKVTEKHVEAMIATDKAIQELKREMLDAKRDLETLKNDVESMRAKKDMLIQLGADARKE
jgi:hypothetical protein